MRSDAGKPKVPFHVRLWPKVAQTGSVTECWEWLGAKNVSGYGCMARRTDTGKSTLAHRIVYEATIGEVPDGMDLDHLCCNPGCVNPWHLEVVTHAENMRRSEHVGRARGAQQRAKTHCPWGHEYSGYNLVVNSKGSRCCRTCMAAQTRERRRRMAA
jgi:hypothetical protein